MRTFVRGASGDGWGSPNSSLSVVFDDRQPGPARDIAPGLLAEAFAIVGAERGRPQLAAPRLLDPVGRDQPQRTIDLRQQADAGRTRQEARDAILDRLQRRIFAAAEPLLI